MVEKQNTWNQLLQKTLQYNKAIEKNLLIIGPKNSGKRTLVNQIQKLSKFQLSQKHQDFNYQLGDPQQCSAVDYTYININEEDFKAKINIYILDSTTSKDILQIYEDDSFFQKLVVGIILDYEQPQNFINVLESWIEALQDLIVKMRIPFAQYDQLKEKLKYFWQNYQEPKFDEEGNLIAKEKFERDLTLTQGILEQNFGFPIVIIQTKGDLLENIQREKDGENKINYIAQSLRTQCLQYGAGLICCSCKNQMNIDVLYDYLLHILFDFPLKLKADISQNNMFIPIGYDSQALIQQTYSNLSVLNDLENFFKNDDKKNQNNIDEVVTEDTEAFLLKFKEKLGGLQSRTSKATNQTGFKQNEGQDDVKNFYTNLKNKQQGKTVMDSGNNLEKKKREKAEEEIMLRYRQSQQKNDFMQESDIKKRHNFE